MTITEIMNNASTRTEMGRPFSFNANVVSNAPAKIAKMPWELTNEELLEMRGLPSRKEAIKLMREQLDDLLGACEIYEDRIADGLEAVFKDWYKNNLPIIEKLERCKNYTGYFEVESDISYDNGADADELCDLVNDMLLNVIPFGAFDRWSYEEKNYMYNGNTFNAGKFRRNPIATMKWEKDRVLTEGRAVKINGYLTEEEKSKLRIVAGTKTTKVMNKLMTYFGVDKIINANKERLGYSYDAWFAKYAEVFSSQRANYKYVCGVNMVSFATSSFGSNWRSCHNIDKKLRAYRQEGDYSDGCHAAGSFSYMCDKSTMISYILSSKAEKRKTIYGNMADASEYCLVPKIYRNLIHLSKDGTRFIQGRVYPQCISSNNVLADAINEEHKKLIAEMWSNNVNDWVTENERRSFGHSDGVRAGDGGQAYADYKHYCVSRQNYFSGSNTKEIIIGESPKCICCGRHKMVEDNLFCDVCLSSCTCSYCGEPINTDDAFRYYDGYYCSITCANNDGVYMCDKCGELMSEGIMVFVNDGCYCEYCAGWIGLKECHKCGEWEYESNMICCGGFYYCSEDCAEEDGYVMCEDCGEWISADNALNAGEWYFCNEDCAKDYGYTKCDECGEWSPTEDCVIIEFAGLTYHFCSEDCAEKYGFTKNERGAYVYTRTETEEA